MRVVRSSVLAAAAMAIGCALASQAVLAQSLSIELRDVAPDRVERQRAEATGALPLPGTPDLASFKERLAEKGLKAGDAMFIRVFKSESQLEVWLRRDDSFVLFATYPICHWSGTLGPKVREGDKQNPEGFYTVTRSQLHLVGRHPRSLNLGFPNPLEKAMGRTGSYILIHGGCSSVGCFAMTNAVMAEIYELAAAALQQGQTHIHVHAFPFRMTEANLKLHENSLWIDYWRNLKQGYDLFEASRIPPRVSICDNKYVLESIRPSEVGTESPLAVCGAMVAALQDLDRLSPLARSLAQRKLREQFLPPQMLQIYSRLENRRPGRQLVEAKLTTRTTTIAGSDRSSLGGPVALPAAAPVPCQLERASCRKWVALQRNLAAKRSARTVRVAGRTAGARRQ